MSIAKFMFDIDVSKYMLEVDELFQCPICLDLYDAPRQLPCRHVFCGACINQVIIAYRQRFKNSNGQIPIFPTCPLCRASFECVVDDVSELDDAAVLNLVKEAVDIVRLMWMETTKTLKSITDDLQRGDTAFSTMSPQEVLKVFCSTPALSTRSMARKRSVQMISVVQGYARSFCHYILYQLQPFPSEDDMVGVLEQAKIRIMAFDRHISEIRRLFNM
jgi:RING-type zinc-finger